MANCPPLIASKAREIAGNDIVTIGNEESWPCNTGNFIRRQNSVTPYPTQRLTFYHVLVLLAFAAI